jgi:hypothetical protein
MKFNNHNLMILILVRKTGTISEGTEYNGQTERLTHPDVPPLQK